MNRLLLTALLLLPASAWAADAWLEDFDAAKKASAATGKPILVDVTGSDWCPPCIQMEAEVFSRADFLPEVTSKYILLRLDYPRDKPQPEKLRVQNKTLATRYAVEGYPTYFLMDSQGYLYGKHAGYVAGGTTAFFALVQGFADQKKTLDALALTLRNAAPGKAKAMAEDVLFRQAEDWSLVSEYGDLPLRIIQEDKDGSAGLKGRYQVYNAYNRLLATWADNDDYHQAVDALDRLAVQAKAWPDLSQRILFTKGMVWLNGLDDEIHARDVFTVVRGMGADTAMGQRAAAILDTLP